MSLILNARVALGRFYFLPAIFAVVVALLLVVVSVQAYADGPEEEQIRSRHVLTVHDAGVTKGVYTDAKTLGEALEKAGIHLEQNDFAEPGLDEELVAASYDVNIYRARPIVIVDGETRMKVMTAYQTPKQIAHQADIELHDEDNATIGYTATSSLVGALETMNIDRATEFTFVLYGKPMELRSQASTVGEMLEEREIAIEANDHLSVSIDAELTEGMKIELWRDGKQTVTVEESIDAPVEQIRDANKEQGYKEVKEAGAKGERSVTYEITMKNGKEVSREEIASVVTKKPKKRVEVIGTKIAAMPYTGGGNKDSWLADSNIPRNQWGYADYLVQRESGWNPNAVNASSGACGLGQQLPCGKWDHHGPWNHPVSGLNGMHEYVMGRYGSWENAVSHSRARGWY